MLKHNALAFSTTTTTSAWKSKLTVNLEELVESKTDNDEYEGFLDMDFMAQAASPLNVIYPDAVSEGEIPHDTHSDVEFDDDQLITRKRKASFLGGANDVEVGSSSKNQVDI
ncbi:unnamed protein product [Lactuca saligna]|uniref:Uncharacterized protein n=1 Tax=Lactuca saligna TaxID=75948 RepID=A0AA36EDG8_LACSI|nr:unnamed protein product [Lactuca saligna]